MTCEETIDPCRMIVEAIKKQVPMKPNAHEEEYTAYYKCPKCGCMLTSKFDGVIVDGMHYPYCYICGQRIDWEGVK